jgi:hypothetical protein
MRVGMPPGQRKRFHVSITEVFNTEPGGGTNGEYSYVVLRATKYMVAGGTRSFAAAQDDNEGAILMVNT